MNNVRILRRLTAGSLQMLALFAAVLMIPAASARASKAGSGLLRTLAYHQITSFTTDLIVNSTPVLSGDGSRVVFAQAPGPEPIRTNHIFVINADGTGQLEVDTYEQRCGCGASLDISADGSKVISSESVQLRIANGDGSGALLLVALQSNEINAIAISGDGSKVFFRVYRNTFTLASDPVERGVWVINADGSGLRQLVGPAQMEALGLPPTDFFGSAGEVLASSTDGASIAFGAFNDPQSGGFGQGLFGVNLDGTGLHDFLGRVGFLLQGGISSDGSKVFYNIITVTPGNGEIGVINFDGTEQLTLADSRTLPNVFPFNDDRVQVSGDGSRLLLGSSGVLVNTDGSGMVKLAISTPSSGELQLLLYDGLFRATMNSSASRFVYLLLDQPRQLATLEIDPESLGEAPSIDNPMIDPPFVLTMTRSAATVSATVSANNPLIRVGNTVLLDGLDDPNVFHQIMLDTGEGFFTNNNVSTNCCAVVGPRTVRVQSGVRGSDNQLHAAAVEFGPFAVVEEAP